MSVLSELSKQLMSTTIHNSKLNVRDPQHTIIPVNRWRSIDHVLTKEFQFQDIKMRNKFVVSLLNYELKTGHFAKLDINGGNVVINVTTEDLGEITEADKEYAAYADVVFKEIVYQSKNVG